MSKVVVVNAGPRIGWNTDTLISQAAKGAESAAGCDLLVGSPTESQQNCVIHAPQATIS